MRFLDLNDIPPEDLVASHDRRCCAAWYVGYHHEDRYEDKTHFHVCVWDLTDGSLVTRELLAYEIDHYHDTVEGAQITGLRFTDDDSQLLVLGEGDEGADVLMRIPIVEQSPQR